MLPGPEKCAFGKDRIEIAGNSVITAEARWHGNKLQRAEEIVEAAGNKNPLEDVELFYWLFFPSDAWSVLEAFCKRFDGWLSWLKSGRGKGWWETRGPLVRSFDFEFGVILSVYIICWAASKIFIFCSYLIVTGLLDSLWDIPLLGWPG